MIKLKRTPLGVTEGSTSGDTAAESARNTRKSKLSRDSKHLALSKRLNWGNVKIDAKFKGLGISLADSKPAEFLYISTESLGVAICVEGTEIAYHLTVKRLQIDNPLDGAFYPTVLRAIDRVHQQPSVVDLLVRQKLNVKQSAVAWGRTPESENTESKIASTGAWMDYQPQPSGESSNAIILHAFKANNTINETIQQNNKQQFDEKVDDTTKNEDVFLMLPIVQLKLSPLSVNVEFLVLRVLLDFTDQLLSALNFTISTPVVDDQKEADAGTTTTKFICIPPAQYYTALHHTIHYSTLYTTVLQRTTHYIL
eukprot:Lankesteria_metandrocarpae@DN4975_c0_g1_i1.p1